MTAGEDRERASLPPDLDRLLHDLRGPLNSAVMHLEVLRRLGPGDPAGRQSLDTIQQELARLALMLPAAFGILALAREEDRVVNLGALVAGVLREPDLKAATMAAGRWPDVRGDTALLRLAVAHLVRNALEATAAAGGDRPPPHVSFAGPAPAGATVTLIVRDWGPGLRSTSAKAMLRLSASTKPGRSGAGLLTVDRVARLHGGALELAAPEGGGAEVRITLPAG